VPRLLSRTLRAPSALVAIALIAAAVVAVPSPAVAATTTGAAMLDTLRVASPTSATYDRSYFPLWIDEDGDGCDTRREVLIAESTITPTVGASCLVSGRWVSLYDGIATTDTSALDVDHVVALREAWVSGASAWTTAQRRAFANDLADPRSLRAVTSTSNQAKGASDPAQWLPAQGVCEYLLDWIAVKVRWSLAVDSTEKSALTSSLTGGCGSTPITAPVVVTGLATENAVPPGTIAAFADGVHRRAGADRYATALAISASFGTGVPVVYVATGANFPDALSAAPAAAAQRGPLLLVPPTGPTTAILDEIRRLAPAQIVVVGGVGVVSAATYQTLSTLAPTIRRDAGVDRYATSRTIVARAFGFAPDVFVATGRNFPDALSASAAAGSLQSPVLLVDGTLSSVSAAVTTQISALSTARVRLVGGTGAISPGIEAALVNQYGRSAVLRHAGADRYATSAAVNRAVFSSASTAFFAVGTNFPDALSGAALAGALASPLYVVTKDCVPTPVLAHVRALAPGSRVLLGGTGALGAGVANLVECAAAPVPSPTPTPTPTKPANPGDTKNCSDFSTQAEAQRWFLTYYPYYGDVARLDGDNNGIACESLR
jgi:putative cell wall-binding protein